MSSNLAPQSWRKSSRSATGNACVEVGRVPGGAAVRDSKTPDGGYFTTTPVQWSSFLTAIKDGRFDG